MRCCEWHRTAGRQDRKAWTNRPMNQGRNDAITMALQFVTLLLLRLCHCRDAIVAQRWCWATRVLQRWCYGWNFVFSYKTIERKWEREREKGVRFETYFPVLLVSITPAPSYNNANSLRHHQHTHPPATVVATAKITQLTSKRNLWLSTWSRESGVFSRIELNCKEGMKMYVDNGRVVTTMSI